MLMFSFKSVRMVGMDNIPENTPVIFMCNHPVGFMEPLIITTRMNRQLYYLARGDFFRKPIFRWLLNQIHIYPIYRFRDGFSDMRNNESAILTAIEFIKTGKSFLIFAEGSTALQRSIRPIQKGVSRIIHDILTENPEQALAIIPVGYNDNNMTKLGTHVTVNFGDPIFPHELFETQPSKPRFLKELTKEVEQKMYDLVPQLSNAQDEKLLNQLIRTNHSDKQDFSLMKSYANKLNVASTAFKEELSKDVQTSYDVVHAQAVSTDGIYHKNSIGSWLALTLGFIPFLIGQIFNHIPFALARRTAKKKVNKPEFTMVMNMVLAAVFFTAWYILWFILLKVFLVPHVFWILAMMIILAVYGRHYVSLYQEKFHYFKARSIRKQIKNSFSLANDQLKQFS